MNVLYSWDCRGVKWALKDNKEKCLEILKHMNIKSFIEKNRDKFPDNNLEITKIITSDDYHYIALDDKYCPINKKEHDENNVFLELTPMS